MAATKGCSAHTDGVLVPYKLQSLMSAEVVIPLGFELVGWFFVGCKDVQICTKTCNVYTKPDFPPLPLYASMKMKSELVLEIFCTKK